MPTDTPPGPLFRGASVAPFAAAVHGARGAFFGSRAELVQSLERGSHSDAPSKAPQSLRSASKVEAVDKLWITDFLL